MDSISWIMLLIYSLKCYQIIEKKSPAWVLDNSSSASHLNGTFALTGLLTSNIVSWFYYYHYSFQPSFFPFFFSLCTLFTLFNEVLIFSDMFIQVVCFTKRKSFKYKWVNQYFFKTWVQISCLNIPQTRPTTFNHNHPCEFWSMHARRLGLFYINSNRIPILMAKPWTLQIPRRIIDCKINLGRQEIHRLI